MIAQSIFDEDKTDVPKMWNGTRYWRFFSTKGTRFSVFKEDVAMFINDNYGKLIKYHYKEEPSKDKKYMYRTITKIIGIVEDPIMSHGWDRIDRMAGNAYVKED